MIFERKIYADLLSWKQNDANQYSLLIEGARRVGKSTIVKLFASQEYDSYIFIDFANVQNEILDCFNDITNLDLFFLRLQTLTGVHLIKVHSLIVFDEIQLFPKARQALKYLVQDGRYHYIATGSLISIRKNVKDILIPSEEKKLQMYPMDYEEFSNACNKNSYSILKELSCSMNAIDAPMHRKLMRDYRIYMAVGGMPQAVQAYIEGKSFFEIDQIKRDIIHLYVDDFKKIDSSGRISALYQSIPSQLSKNTKRFVLSSATNKRQTSKDDERIFDLIDSKTVLISYNTSDPRVSLSFTKTNESFKLYLADTGLFVTLLFMDRPVLNNEIYAKLLSEKLPANLGYLYENVVAQTIASKNHDLYYHTWDKKNSTHYYEVDFLVSHRDKMNAIEVKSSGIGKHESLTNFRQKYSKSLNHSYVLSQKLPKKEGNLQFIPFYLFDFFINE